MNIITPAEARVLLERTRRWDDNTDANREMRPDIEPLAETVLALWPFVEAWSKRRCNMTHIYPLGCGHCWPCQARRLLQEEKP